MQLLYAFISIPSGAIKSATWTNYINRFFRISIPSGAIKSVFAVFAEKIEQSFQFLLVRLRVDTHCHRTSPETISIPSGAIKSIVLPAPQTAFF